MDLRKNTSVGFANTSTELRFEGEQFLQDYLNPENKRGCGDHLDPECLCDVDVSKTAGMTFDKAPRDLMGVTTREELVLAGANVWLNLDLAQGLHYVPAWWESPNREEMLAKTIELLKQRKGQKAISKALGIPRMDDKFLALLRKCIGVPHRSHLADPVPKARIITLHNEGKSVLQISRQITKERGFLLAYRSVYRVLAENDLTPHVSGVYGRPLGYKANSGITYADWRAGVRPPDYEG